MRRIRNLTLPAVLIWGCLMTGESLPVVVNGNNNSNLFQGIDAKKYAQRTAGSSFLSALDRVVPHQSGPINYDTFITVVEGMVDTQ